MILSVSRRTDIPNYYSDWFFNRLREGYLYVRNPVNYHQVSRIALSPSTVDCIVFWSKNPEPMFKRIGELKDYKYYFQFTLTGYGRDLEPNLPPKREELLRTFQRLSLQTGKERVVWRYDPIVMTDRYTSEYHIKAFREIAEALNGYTDRVVISFMDFYAKTLKNMKGINITGFDLANSAGQSPGSAPALLHLASELAAIARENQMSISSCAEHIDLSSCGISHGSCIDRELVEQITGSRIEAKKDKNQRAECGCIESVEVGSYDTCQNGCRYCYANVSADRVRENSARYNPDAPLLCGTVTESDRVTDRAVKSLKAEQMSLWDMTVM